MKLPRERRVELLDAAVELWGDREAARIPVRDGDVSMRPTLVAGQVLWVEFAQAELRPGDILLFRQEDYLVVHRLLGRATFPDGRPSLRTRGDGWNGLDPHLEARNVVGLVTAARDERGWWDLRRPIARLYARSVAHHDLFWAAVGSGAGVVDGVLFRRPSRGPLRAAVSMLDRGLLSLGHAICFRLAHSRREPPRDPEAESPAAILKDR